MDSHGLRFENWSALCLGSHPDQECGCGFAAVFTGVFKAVEWCVVSRQMTSLQLCGRSVGSENGSGDSEAISAGRKSDLHEGGNRWATEKGRGTHFIWEGELLTKLQCFHYVFIITIYTYKEPYCPICYFCLECSFSDINTNLISFSFCCLYWVYSYPSCTFKKILLL